MVQRHLSLRPTVKAGLVVLVSGCLPLFALAQDSSEDGERADATASSRPSDEQARLDRRVQFTFRYTPWEDVLKWLADQSGLAFSPDVIPDGTFGVDVSQEMTLKDATDLINKYLLIRGYTVLRTDSTLLVLDYEEPVDAQLVRELLGETPLSELDQRGDYEMAKTRFTVEHMDPVKAEEQVRALLNPFGSLMIFPGAKEIVATDTGRTLRSIRDIFKKIEEVAEEESGTKLHVFELPNSDGNKALNIARPLVGIDADKFAAEDGSISITVGPQGKRVYATGKPEKVKIVKQVVEAFGAVNNGPIEPHTFIVHRITSAQSESVLRVLQTHFEGDPQMRLAIDDRTGGIMAYATATQHLQIKAAIREMESTADQFEVIPLRTFDPTTATLLVGNLFSTARNPPIIDGTTSPPQLVVKGTESQIKQIRSVLEQMGEQFEGSGIAMRQQGNVRILQLDPQTAAEVAEKIRDIWPSVGQNPLRVVIPSESSSAVRTVRPGSTGSESANPAPNRTRHGAPQQPGPADGNRPRRPQRPADGDEETGDRTAALGQLDLDHPAGFQILTVSEQQPSDGVADEAPATGPQESPSDLPSDESPNDGGSNEDAVQNDAPPIVILPTPNGLMIRSDDQEALNNIESLIELFASQSGGDGPRFHLFYLKHVDAESASQTLTSLLSGPAASTGTQSTTPSLSGALASTGPPHIVAEKRLNALYVQGSPGQIAMVNQLLGSIDIESGPEDVLTFPKPQFIQVRNSSVEEVAKVVKEVFANRIETGENNNRNNGRDSGRGRGGFPFFGGRGRGDDGGSSATQESTGKVDKMTIGVDIGSNSLVVSASAPLFKEVEAVVFELDQRSAQTPPPSVGVVHLKHTNPQYLRDLLVNSLGEEAQSSGSGGNNNGRGGAATARGGRGTTTQAVPFGGFGGGRFGGGRFGGGFGGGDTQGGGGNRGGRGGGRGG